MWLILWAISFLWILVDTQKRKTKKIWWRIFALFVPYLTLPVYALYVYKLRKNYPDKLTGINARIGIVLSLFLSASLIIPAAYGFRVAVIIDKMIETELAEYGADKIKVSSVFVPFAFALFWGTYNGSAYLVDDYGGNQGSMPFVVVNDGNGFNLHISSLNYLKVAFEEINIRQLELAARQGDARAQIGLSLKYWIGTYVKKDYLVMYMWADIAAKNGNKYGSVVRDLVATGVEKSGDITIMHVTPLTGADIAIAKRMSTRCMASNYEVCGY